MSSPPEVYLYTDGACRGNPGPGGWAFILRHLASGKELRRSGGVADTTNNRMELMAVTEGLRALTRPTRVVIVTDSEYVKKGITEWIAGWVRNNWRRGKKGPPVKNRELWQALLDETERHEVTFEWVAGHAGHPENEACDAMAVAAALAITSDG